MQFNKVKDSEIPESWIYLTTAENEFEFNIIKGKLTESNIVCVGKGRDLDLLDSGILKIVLGPCVPVDILVPVEMYEEAKLIIEFKISDEELEEQAVAQEQYEEKDEEKE